MTPRSGILAAHGLYGIVDATSGKAYPFSLLLKDAEALLLGPHGLSGPPLGKEKPRRWSGLGAVEGRQRYVYPPTIFSTRLSGLSHMPEILYLRGRSIFFRRLAKDYDEAGQRRFGPSSRSLRPISRRRSSR